ncbi:MAG: hypothetical protein NC344_03315 [Bacteroidales bacterium]|nr:hypothetical protein [Bacteroidales bacterium]MCM1146860.1 hypothetical protein [Bacteroidales bacterium]MCM1205642.1 hypothetical protein [Bacillota bacterium]MCM1510246.1 hypothetical protein [Clostridium sp.]
MSRNKSKRELGRARKAARDEKEGKNVVNIIFGVLIALAIAFLLYVVAVFQ